MSIKERVVCKTVKNAFALYFYSTLG